MEALPLCLFQLFECQTWQQMNTHPGDSVLLLKIGFSPTDVMEVHLLHFSDESVGKLNVNSV